MTSATPSALESALLIVGDRWNLQIIRSCFQGARRFQDLRNELSISDAVLAQRLRGLVASGVLRTESYSVSPPRHEYRLTDAGKELWSVFVAMWSWDRRWAPGSPGALGTHLIHLPCGNAVTPVFGCGQCGAIGVTARDTETTLDENDAPRGATRSRRSTATDLGEFRDSTVVLADRWSTFLLAAALLGAHRFSEFKRRLPGISPFTLTERLGVFVETEMLSRAPVAEGAGRHEYLLTPKSFDFFVVFALLNGWAEHSLADGRGGSSGLLITHRACGEPLVPRFTCNCCNQELQRREVEFQTRHSGRGYGAEGTA
ncbi:transcriptional regulator, HxlR family [Frankineae bacterium MT45]|nr:transcriptional regulator, HxlR family [Frankineae bacterium MT45]